MITEKEMHQLVREEVCIALSTALPVLAERIERAISLASNGNNNRSEYTSVPTDRRLRESLVPK